MPLMTLSKYTINIVTGKLSKTRENQSFAFPLSIDMILVEEERKRIGGGGVERIKKNSREARLCFFLIVIGTVGDSIRFPVSLGLLSPFPV